MPQQITARTISIGPAGSMKPPEGSQDSSTPAAVITDSASHSRRPACSRNTATAMSAVAAPSRLVRSEPAKPDTVVSPLIMRIGARTPPARMAPASHGASFRSSGADGREGRMTLTIVRPMNAPTYSKPASATGSRSSSSTFATGGLMPNRAVEMMTYINGLASIVLTRCRSRLLH